MDSTLICGSSNTRRLPAIFDTLTQQQRCELAGNAVAWYYIDRRGAWAALPMDYRRAVAHITAMAKLSAAQFGEPSKGCKADEIWVRLQYDMVSWDGLPSQRHCLLTQAVQVARQHGLDDTAKFSWCSRFVAEVKTATKVGASIFTFEQELRRQTNEEVRDSAQRNVAVAVWLYVVSRIRCETAGRPSIGEYSRRELYRRSVSIFRCRSERQK